MAFSLAVHVPTGRYRCFHKNTLCQWMLKIMYASDRSLLVLHRSSVGSTPFCAVLKSVWKIYVAIFYQTALRLHPHLFIFNAPQAKFPVCRVAPAINSHFTLSLTLFLTTLMVNAVLKEFSMFFVSRGIRWYVSRTARCN